jgi:hypothetical protein
MKVLFAALAAIAALALAGSALGDTFITDTLAPGGGSSSQPQGYRFITDTLAPGGGSSEVVVQGSNGFSWSDAGVGAGVAAGAILALIGSTLILIRRQGRLAV